MSGSLISKIIAGVVALYYLILGWLPPLIYDYDVLKNVSYAESESAVMDLYLPAEAAEREEAGCVIVIHGGSYSGGDKKEDRIRCHRLARKGYVVAAINYTLYKENSGYSIDLVLDEISAAISTVSDIAAEHGINLGGVATVGYSAGGHIAMLYAYTRADVSPLPIRFTASLAGPAELSYDIWGETSYRLTTMLTGTAVTPDTIESGEADALAAQLSPTTHIHAGSVPTLMGYSEADETVTIENADALAAALTEAGVEYTDIRFTRSDHDMMGFRRLKYNRTLKKFCREYFGY